jgi:hypothetical protein
MESLSSVVIVITFDVRPLQSIANLIGYHFTELSQQQTLRMKFFRPLVAVALP